MPPLGAALALELAQLLFGAHDVGRDHAPVQLDLRLAGAAACADSTALALQVRPAPNQAGAEVLQPRQLHLQLAFVAFGPLGKNFQNQKCAVCHRQFQQALEVALLARADRLVKQDFSRTQLGCQFFDFLGFSASDKQGGIGCAALAGDAPDRL